MEVILKEDVAKLGARGEVVTVAEGYGRNYLLPKKLAVKQARTTTLLPARKFAISIIGCFMPATCYPHIPIFAPERLSQA